MNQNLPFIPETITVHLGPPNSNAENVTVNFLDYIANVASSEIYPTWNESAIKANILAEISFALNRFYTEYYRSRGYGFDITNSTASDQSFVNGRVIFDNIYNLCGEIFNSYISRIGNVEPLFASYCDGIETNCGGMSQWGSQALAEEGRSAIEILKFYYGDDIEIVTDVPVMGGNIPTPFFPIRLGQSGDGVRSVQIRLNRVSNNYPLIPKVAEIDGNFTLDTLNSVRAFQKSFNLDVDGIVGPVTWYTLQNVYFAVKRLNEITSEGITLDEVTQQYPSLLNLGSAGIGVSNLQYYINYLSLYYNTIPEVQIDGVFDEETRAAVIDVQNTLGLMPDGIVGRLTWEAIYNIYLGIISTVPREFTEGQTLPFPGVVLRIGSESEDVRIYQEYLSYISQYYDEIPAVNITGYFGNLTREATIALQELSDIPVTGAVGVLTWDAAATAYEDLYSAQTTNEGQYPGYEIGGAS